LVAVPAKFGLPIAWGRVPRALVERGGSLAAKDGWKIPPVVHGQIMAFSLAAAIAERWMSEFADEDEIAQMIMENDDQSRKFFYVTQRFLSDSRLNQQFLQKMSISNCRGLSILCILSRRRIRALYR
jgi:hypothetical protein